MGNADDYYNHCKVVCVDNRMMYIGSDNAYPSFDEEHGISIDDAAAVKTRQDKFWMGMWNRSAVPTDEGIAEQK